MAAALRQAPITFQSRCPPSVGSSSPPKPLAFSFSSGLRLNFTLKITKKSRSRRGGALAATMYGSAASSYASALAEIANTSTENLEAFASDVEKLDQIFSDPDIFSFFTSPIVLDEDKLAVIEDIASTANLQPDVKNFLNVLIDSDRIDAIRDIVKEFDLKYNEITGTEMAVVTSVVPLESQQLAQIAKEVQKLTGAKNVRIKTAIDPSLVAGFTIRYGATGSSMVDMSVKKQLEDIAAELDIPEVQLAA